MREWRERGFSASGHSTLQQSHMVIVLILVSISDNGPTVVENSLSTWYRVIHSRVGAHELFWHNFGHKR